MHYYAHHVGDFIKDTANLDDHQMATYLRLIWRYYTDEKPITGELEDLAFAMRTDEKTMRLLLRHYFTETPEGWRNSRCDREIEAFHLKSEKSQKAANARWNSGKNMRPQCARNASASLSDANQEPITKNHIKNDKLAASAAIDDPVKNLFNAGIPILVQSGATTANARSLIGKLRKVIGDEQAAAAIVAAKAVSDPAAYLSACMQPKKREVAY